VSKLRPMEKLLTYLADHAELLFNIVAAFVSAVVTALLRILADPNEQRPTRIILEMITCGTMALAAYSAILALGLDSKWVVFIGSCIGYLGSYNVRQLALKFFGSKLK
jgi:lambda family phage holin